MNKKIFKELFILLLLLVVVIFIIEILFYNFITDTKVSCNSIEYVESKEVEQIIEDIGNITSNTVIQENYKIEENQLTEKSTEETNYETGKKDPFSNYVKDEAENIQSNDTGDNSDSENGTTGTFFEKANMK